MPPKDNRPQTEDVTRTKGNDFDDFYLKRELLDPSSPIHNMSVKDIWNSDSRYKRYPLFPKYYEVLKARVEAEKKQVQPQVMMLLY